MIFGSTVFNILGPLTNPARPTYFLLGVYDEYLVEPVAKVLAKLGVRRAYVVYGTDRMDEISLSAPTAVCELKEGYYRSFTLQPEDFGLKRCKKEDLLGGTPAKNAQAVRDILTGKLDGPKRDVALLNAGAALHVCGVADSVAEGIEVAREQIASGNAIRTLDAFIRQSNA